MSQPRFTKYLLLTLIIIIGAFLRFHQLATVPPSAGWDAAYYGVDALRIMQGDRPVYLYPNGGREAMFSYIVALMFAGAGASEFTLHLTAAIIGILTIPVTFLVTNELLRKQRQRLVREYAGVIAAAMLAVSYWHVVWSRFGVRAILAPLFIALTIYFILRGLRTDQRRWFVIGGLWGGASLYTYQVAQLLPPLLAILFVIMYPAYRRRIGWRRYCGHIGLTLAVAFVVVAPLLSFAYNHPSVYTARVRDVALIDNAQSFDEQAANVIDRLVQVIRFFTVEGDASAEYAVNGRAGLHWLFQFGLAIGLAQALWNIRTPHAQLMLLWLLVMLIPAGLGGIGTVSKRAIGTLPVVSALVAWGLLSAGLLLHKKPLGPRLLTTIRKPLLVLALALGFGFAFRATYRDYFEVYAHSDKIAGVFDPQISEMAHYIEQLPPDELVYLSPEHPHHPNMLFHTRLRSESSANVRGYNGWHCFVAPFSTERATTFVFSEPNSVLLLQQYYPNGTYLPGNLSDVYGYGDYFGAYRIPEGESADFHPQHPTQANWSDKIALLGYNLAGTQYLPGQTIDLTVYLRALAKMSTRYTTFVHLLDPIAVASGQPPLRGQRDVEPCNTYYPTTVWQPDEIIRDTYTVQIALDTQPGTYQLAIGFYTWYDLKRLPIGSDEMLVLTTIQVLSPE